MNAVAGQLLQERGSDSRVFNTTTTLERLLGRYEQARRPITVNFRRLVPWMRVGERATHYLHPYPAKLLPHIPAFFLANSILTSPGDIVLDPFCGSGTVLLECALHGRLGLGADSNPLARLIASAKVDDVHPDELRSVLDAVVRRAAHSRRASPPDVVNLRYWFYPHVIDRLARLRHAIDSVQGAKARNFLLVCLSACARRTSLADPRLSVPVRLRKDQYPPGHPLREASNATLRRLRRQDVFSEFSTIAHSNISRVEAYRTLRKPQGSGRVVGSDARLLAAAGGPLAQRRGTVDMIITSPPYVGAQKYIRASSLSLGWVGLLGGRSLRELEDENIGREHLSIRRLGSPPSTGILEADERLATVATRNLLRAHIASTYLLEMRVALAESVSLLRAGGHLVLVAGSNRVGGVRFRTPQYLRTIAEELGLVTRLELVDAIRSRGLMTRRNATASVITRESVLLFQRPVL